MEHWDEIRTAFHVARQGTVSGAADVLGVHHATVIRHIDALEGRLGVKLFQRHARGYTPTEAGTDLMRVAQATEEQFGQLEARMKGRGDAVEGELVLTSLPALSGLLVPALARFHEAYPDVILRYLTGNRLFRLEYGEAHVALRAGPAPDQPDNVVQKFMDQSMALYASQDYVARYGLPETEADLPAHRYVGADDPESRAPFDRWMREAIPREHVMFRSADHHVLATALVEGAGMGFLPEWQGNADPRLVRVMKPRPDWSAPLWLVTHVDLHRTSKVQALLSHLKESAKTWQASG